MASAKKKLLIVVPALECGGLEKNVAMICNNIDTLKFDVTLAVLNNSNPFFLITNKAVKIVDLQTLNVRKSLLSILSLSRKVKPGIILTTANHLNLLFAIFKPLFPKRIKLVARESSIVSINSKRARLPAVYNFLIKTFYHKLDFIVCQSAFMQDDLVMHYNVPPGKTNIIYNAVDIPVSINMPNPVSAFANLVTVSRLSEEKGLDRLIKAVSLLQIPYRFTIIGEGNMRNVLQQLINDLSLQHKVFLAGSYAEPFSQVVSPDLFLMGSHYEGFPNTLLEATSLGIPVVAFNAPGGISEVIQNYQNGILVSGNDVHDFAEAIKEALLFNFDKNKISELTLNKFNAKSIIAEWERLLL